jgi:hypothetical protein
MYITPNFFPGAIDSATNAQLAPYGGAPYWAPSAIARGEFSTDDSRKKASIIEIFEPDGNGGQKFYASVVGKFKGAVISGVRYFIDDYIVYRYADVLLMKAEAENALGMDPSAEINEVRKRAYGADFAQHVFVAGSKASNDDALLDERFKELMFEGKRWWDLIRFGKAFELIPSLKNRNNDKNLLLFPIPTSTLSLNAKLTQNPGY